MSSSNNLKIDTEEEIKSITNEDNQKSPGKKFHNNSNN